MKKITNILAGIGISVSITLFIIKTGNLPCGSENCGEVINSKYGSILGIPVTLFSIILWTFILGNIEYKHINKKIYSIFLLIGSITFILIQKFIIHKFCPFCVTHAIIAITYAVIILKSKKTITHNSNFGLYGLILACIFISISSKEKSYTLNLPQEKDNQNVKIEKIDKPKESNKSNKLLHTEIEENIDEFDFQGLKWKNQNLIDANNSIIKVYSLTCKHCRIELINKIRKKEKITPYIMNISKRFEESMIQIYGTVSSEKEFENYLFKILNNYQNWSKNPLEETYKITGFQNITPERESKARMQIVKQKNTIRKYKVKKFPSKIKISK